MRIALVAPPFIPVPPKVYGGTELFISHLAEGLKRRGLDVVVYCNGESTVNVERRWLYKQAQWPITGEVYANLKDINHTAWAVRDAAENCDVIHLNNLPGLAHSRFVQTAFAYTIHHPTEPGLTAFYDHYPNVNYVTISDYQRFRERMPKIRTIHHGIDLSLYEPQSRKAQYLSFLGRIAPIKGTHIAVQVALKSGIPLKIAGEVQPSFRDYFDTQVKPYVDGKLIEYIGEADLSAKNELLGNSSAMLFPIQWDEPFGLVMIEAMACGTPVLALPGGSVHEVVRDGVSGWVCRSVDDLVEKAKRVDRDFNANKVRRYVAEHFSLDAMVSKYARFYQEIVSTTSATSIGNEVMKPRTADQQETAEPRLFSRAV
jgi:glycosyltransferase involved in cell wall biosynthesis